MDKYPSASARDMGSIPGLGRFHLPRTTKAMCHNLSAPVLQVLKPVCLESVLCNKRSHHNENCALHIIQYYIKLHIIPYYIQLHTIHYIQYNVHYNKE